MQKPELQVTNLAKITLNHIVGKGDKIKIDKDELAQKVAKNRRKSQRELKPKSGSYAFKDKSKYNRKKKHKKGPDLGD